jgi:hypothetical protein
VRRRDIAAPIIVALIALGALALFAFLVISEIAPAVARL